jgi:hypothetical protein
MTETDLVRNYSLLSVLPQHAGCLCQLTVTMEARDNCKQKQMEHEFFVILRYGAALLGD